MEFMSGDFSDAIMSDVHALLSSDVPYLSKIKEAFGDHSPAKLYKLLNANNNVSASFLIVADALDSSVEEGPHGPLVMSGIPYGVLENAAPLYVALFTQDMLMED